MAVSQDNKNATTTAFSTGGTIAYTVGASANYLIFDWQDDNETSVSAVTYNGTSMSLLTSNSATGVRLERWGLANPATGTHDLVYTLVGATLGSARFIHSYIGVGTVTSNSKNTDTGTTVSNSITSTSTNDLVVDVTAIDTASGTMTADGGQTDFINTTWFYGGQQGTASYKTGANSSITMGWTDTVSVNHSVQIISNLAGSGGFVPIQGNSNQFLGLLGVGT